MDILIRDAESWERCEDFGALCVTLEQHHIQALPGQDRKFRLLLVAAVRSIWDHITLPDSRAGMEAAERYADDPGFEEMEAIHQRAILATEDAERRRRERFPELMRQTPETWIAQAVVQAANPGDLHDTGDPPVWYDAMLALQSELVPGQSRAAADVFHARLLRDLFPNPYRPPSFAPAWRTEAVLAVARTVYESRDFSDLPVLADALEEAGCTSADVLDHCRKPGLHVRGCWVVDGLLERG